MKQFFSLLIGLAIACSAFSQVAIGVQGTGNLSDANLDATDFFALSKKARVMPGAGIVADITVNPGLLIRTGLNYQQNGITLKATLPGLPGEIDEIRTEAKLNLHYVQLPVNVLYSTKGSTKFFVGGGPYVSFAVSGKSKMESTIKFSDGSVETEKEETNVFEKDEEGNTSFKRFDYGLGAIAGVKLPGGLFANVGYQFSLANISKSEESKYNNRALQLTIGYYLWQK